MKEKIEEILGRYTNSPVAFDDGVERVTFQERYFPISDLVKELSTLIQDEKEDSFINGFEVGYANGVYEYKKDLTDQPLTSSIWGKRIKDKWYKELWWSIIEFIRRNK